MGGLLIIGLTGTFASGKSTIARMFEECGASVIDADAIAHSVVKPGMPALQEIRDAFGPSYLLPDGSLDRKRMAALVFASSEQREKLEAIIHPIVQEETERRIEHYRALYQRNGMPRAVVLNIPLLFEKGLQRMADKTVVVAIEEAERFRRARQRDGLGEQEVVRRLAAQWPQRRKIALADHVIDNSGPPEAARRQVKKIFNHGLNDESQDLLQQEMLQITKGG